MSIANDQLIPAFRKSGKTQEDFCAEHGISPHKLRYYLYKRGKRIQSLRPKRHLKPAMPTQSAPSFISFNHNTNHRSDKKQAFTIITGRFTINEMAQLLRALEGVSC